MGRGTTQEPLGEVRVATDSVTQCIEPTDQVLPSPIKPSDLGMQGGSGGIPGRILLPRMGPEHSFQGC